jgi:hypothetical protein
MNSILICHVQTLTNSCPRSLQAAVSEQRVIERWTSSSGAGGGSARRLWRWIYAAKVPPSAFDHHSWPAVFAALKTARRQRG